VKGHGGHSSVRVGKTVKTKAGASVLRSNRRGIGARRLFFEASSRSIILFERDLGANAFGVLSAKGNPASVFSDHALDIVKRCHRHVGISPAIFIAALDRIGKKAAQIFTVAHGMQDLPALFRKDAGSLLAVPTRHCRACSQQSERAAL
jgi:hypothetical protein